MSGSRAPEVQIRGTLMADGPQRAGLILALITPDEELQKGWLPPETGGNAAVYTEHGKPFQMAEIVLIRVETYANYIF